MRVLSVLLVAIAMTMLMAWQSCAETVYVSDRLIVGVRDVPEGSVPSITTLKSDDAVELLEAGDTYSKVKLANGTEGYIKKQYLTNKRPKSLLIADLEKQLARQKQVVTDMKSSMSGSQSKLQEDQAELQASISELKSQLADRDKQLVESGKQLTAASKALEKAQQDYQTLQKDAADVVSIVKAREKLQKENERLTDELNTMREDSVYLLTVFYIKWFLAGAGVMLVGWMIGKSSRRKRRY